MFVKFFKMVFGAVLGFACAIFIISLVLGLLYAFLG